VSIARVRVASSSDPRRVNTIRSPATTWGGMPRRSVRKETANSNVRRLRLCETVRRIRKRWASGTSHLAVVNSRCAHGLQEPFSPQPKATSRLARNNRRRPETSIPTILLVTSGSPYHQRFPLSIWFLPSILPSGRHSRSLVSNSCRAVKKGE
jgi:hypothetical protein